MNNLIALLTSFLGRVAESVSYWASELLKGLIKAGTTFWAALVLAAGLAWTIGHYIVLAMTDMVASIAAISTGSYTLAVPSGVSSVLAIGNTFTPLNEAFAYAAAYFTIMLVMLLYRNVKSWIPTLSGS